MRPSLCIDLGAAFTKIAWRPRPDAPAHLARDPQPMDGVDAFCVPSVAAHDRKTDRWVFGAEAAELRASDRIRVYQNWKADLFLPDEDRHGGIELLDGASVATTAILLDRHPHLRAMDIAARYLCWLYDEQIPAMLGHRDFVGAEVTICVPEFVRDEPVFAAQLDLVMRWAGFRNGGEYTLSEPQANLVGVLTQGENHVDNGRPRVSAMLGPVASALSSPRQGMLFVDVGAFTTDLAIAGLAGGVDFGPRRSRSMRLGVSALDARILQGSPSKEQVDGSLLEREAFHRAVYGPVVRGREYGLDEAGVRREMEDFARAILAQVDRFLADHEEVTLAAAVLTGGGANVRGVSEALAAGLATRGVGVMYVPAETSAPLNVQRHALPAEVVRGASAVGGASVLFASRTALGDLRADARR